MYLFWRPRLPFLLLSPTIHAPAVQTGSENDYEGGGTSDTAYQQVHDGLCTTPNPNIGAPAGFLIGLALGVAYTAVNIVFSNTPPLPPPPPSSQLPQDCDDGEVNAGNYPVDMSTSGRSTSEAAAIRRYAKLSNSWLAKYGPVKIQPTTLMRAAASAAAEAERSRAAVAGQPYSGQVGHVPDTAITGNPQPPCGWLDMPGTSNQVAGGVLGSRIGNLISHFTVDGVLP